MSALLQIQEVSKAFGGVQAVNRVTLDVNRGDLMSVIGPNGAGKTSLLNMISGFYHPDRVRITLDGVDVTHEAPSRIAERGVARTFQNIALFRGMTVLDNLMLGRHVHMKTGVVGAFVYWGFAQREEVAHRQRVEDIIAALDAGKLSGAVLDVFEQEPLPPEHPAWTHPKLLVTPHLASLPPRSERAAYVAQLIAAHERGEPFPHCYDHERGY